MEMLLELRDVFYDKTYKDTCLNFNGSKQKQYLFIYICLNFQNLALLSKINSHHLKI
jgi:hypothetical protein